MNTDQPESWCEGLLLSANEELEQRYREQASACLALLISRNYRLLLTHNEHPLKKQLWRALAERWMLSYQLHNRSLPSKHLGVSYGRM